MEAISDEDLEMLKYVAAVLEAGLPEAAFIQIARVYGQALAQIAETEVRLFHMYIHEPLMRSGVSDRRSPSRWTASCASWCRSSRR